MSKTKNKKIKIFNILYEHILNNKREYFIIIILFFIGIVIGSLIINNIPDNRVAEINTYLNNICINAKNSENINKINLLKKSLISNAIVIFILWFGTSTVIGIPIVYGAAIFKGFSIGYTISSIISTFGYGSGIIISISLLLLHNILFIPAMFVTCTSGIKLYKSIMKNRDRDNIKFEILRHTIICILMLVIMEISAVIQTYISTNIFIILLKYIKI